LTFSWDKERGRIWGRR